MFADLKLRYLLITFMALLTSCGTEQHGDRLHSIVVEVTGDNFNWYFRYPGSDGVLGNDDDQHSVQHLYLPDNTMVTLQLKSKDYLYSFALPEMQLKQIAVPDMDFELQFKTGPEATLQLLGDQFCGYAHNNLVGEVRVRNQDSGFYGWTKKRINAE